MNMIEYKLRVDSDHPMSNGRAMRCGYMVSACTMLQVIGVRKPVSRLTPRPRGDCSDAAMDLRPALLSRARVVCRSA